MLPSHLPLQALIKRDRGAENVGLGEVPQPEPGSEEVLTEVLHIGICGTDLHL